MHSNNFFLELNTYQNGKIRRVKEGKDCEENLLNRNRWRLAHKYFPLHSDDWLSQNTAPPLLRLSDLEIKQNDP